MNIGHEENGKNQLYERPILVLKKFNRHIFLGIPLSSSLKENPYYQQVRYHNKKHSCIISQIRLLSSKRLLRRLVRLRETEFKKVQEKINMIIQQNDPLL